MDNTDRAEQILENIIHATIATSSKDGQPWNSPVRFVHDVDLGESSGYQ